MKACWLSQGKATQKQRSASTGLIIEKASYWSWPKNCQPISGSPQIGELFALNSNDNPRCVGLLQIALQMPYIMDQFFFTSDLIFTFTGKQ